MLHPSLIKLERTLQGFARRKEPGALLLTGEWGVGKTHACLESLKAPDEDKQLSFSYVSLYGVTDAEGIYSRIALGWHNSVTSKAPDWVRDAVGVSGKTAKGIADIFKAGSLVQTLGTSGVGMFTRNALVVIDDLERRDEKLSIDAVMGVVSFLVESRNCRLIFISNEDALSAKDREKFDSQKEKVFDSEFEYAPTCEENVDLLARENAEYILPSAKALQVRNLRVLRVVNRLLATLKEHIKNSHDRTYKAVLNSAAVLGLLHYGFRSKVNLRDSKELSSASSSFYLEDDSELSESIRILRKAGFKAGPADSEILEFLMTGYLDWEKLNDNLKDREVYFRQVEAQQSLSEMINACSVNFSTTQEEIVPKMKEICEMNAEYISPANLEAATNILLELGEQSDLDKWMARWEKFNLNRLTNQEILSILEGMDSYPDNRKVFIQEEANRRTGSPDIEKTLRQRFSERMYLNSHIEYIAALPIDAYRRFITSRSDDIRFLVRQVFEHFHGKKSPLGDIAAKTLQVVEEQRGTSRLNNYRVKVLKLSLPNQKKSATMQQKNDATQ